MCEHALPSFARQYSSIAGVISRCNPCTSIFTSPPPPAATRTRARLPKRVTEELVFFRARPPLALARITLARAIIAVVIVPIVTVELDSIDSSRVPSSSPSRVLTGANRSIDANGFPRSIARDRGSRSLSRVAVTTPTASDRALTRIRASAPSRVSNESLWSIYGHHSRS